MKFETIWFLSEHISKPVAKQKFRVVLVYQGDEDIGLLVTDIFIIDFGCQIRYVIQLCCAVNVPYLILTAVKILPVDISRMCEKPIQDEVEVVLIEIALSKILPVATFVEIYTGLAMLSSTSIKIE